MRTDCSSTSWGPRRSSNTAIESASTPISLTCGKMPRIHSAPSVARRSGLQEARIQAERLSNHCFPSICAAARPGASGFGAELLLWQLVTTMSKAEMSWCFALRTFSEGCVGAVERLLHECPAAGVKPRQQCGRLNAPAIERANMATTDDKARQTKHRVVCLEEHTVLCLPF